MSKEPIYHHYGKVVKGHLVFQYPELYQSVKNKLEGKEFDLVLKEKFKKVTLDQHGYYRAGIIREALRYESFGGWTEDELHDFFADMFLKETVVKTIDGTQYPVTSIRSTKDLSVQEMKEFIERVIQWLAEHDIVVLTPEQYYTK